MARFSRRSLLIAVYALTAFSGLFSLSLDEAVELALRESLNLRKSSLDLALSDYAAKRLWSEIFPSFSLNGGLSFGSPLASGGGFKADQSAMSYSLSFGLSLSLNMGITEAMKRIELAYGPGFWITSRPKSSWKSR